MPRVNLTAVSVEKIKPPASGQVEYYDKRLPAFGLRLSYRGGRSWFLMTRVDGKLVRLTLGKYPLLSLAEARDKARGMARLVSEGKDPRKIAIEANRRREEELANTFEACAADFMEHYVRRRLRPSTQREYQRILRGPDTRSWRDRPVAAIVKRDVIDVLDAMERRGAPGAANRALAYLRRFFNWCAERDIIAVAPTDRVALRHPEIARDRVISADELRFLIRTVDDETSIFGDVIRVLLLTGQRRGEVAGMRWSEIKGIDSGEPVWEIPGRRTKNKQNHLVPLSSVMGRHIRRLARARDGDLVFTTNGITPVSGFGKAKARIDQRIDSARAAAGLEPMAPWTLHDLRRTMVTAMNEQLGIQPHIVEAVVNHISGLAKAGVAGVYNRALYLDERRRALEEWATLVSRLAPSDRASA